MSEFLCMKTFLSSPRSFTVIAASLIVLGYDSAIAGRASGKKARPIALSNLF
jgi:hypothetical protein